MIATFVTLMALGTVLTIAAGAFTLTEWTPGRGKVATVCIVVGVASLASGMLLALVMALVT